MARTFVIQDGWYGGKVLSVSKYVKQVDGVEIKILHDITNPRTRQLRWTQTVSENGSFFKACGLSTYVDPWAPNVDPSGKTVCKADDTKPFYWTDAEYRGKDGPYFYDKPSEGAPAAGNTWLRFVTSLTEARSTNVIVLASVVWGFDRAAGGAVTVIEPRRATPPERSGHMRVLKRMYPSYDYSYFAPDVEPNASGDAIA
ncbi:MAG: hypothetical protein U0167_07275 [bacterium]